MKFVCLQNQNQTDNKSLKGALWKSFPIESKMKEEYC